MAPDEGGAAPPTSPGPGPGEDPPASGEATPRPRRATEDAFAATVAPTSPVPPVALPGGTLNSVGEARARISRLEIDATQTAALAGALPPLPVVSDSCYVADREIARGGMGRIIAAQDQRLGRKVALKELLEPAGEQLTRFQREALITARLQHPGIVPVYEAGRWPSGEPFFAMKLVSGRPLDRVIADARTLEDRLALLPRIAAATDAIAYAHSQRVVHRDLKPANVLIGDFGETVVIDWGLAKDLEAGDSLESANRPPITRPSTRKIDSNGSSLTVAGAVMGTPAYMAPEQARGEPVDERADVFALGAMLYHLLAGVPPYNARTATDVIAAAALGRVVPLSEREAGAPHDLVAIVDRAMAPVPADRYAHAGELADELRRFLTGQLVSAHRYTTLQRVMRFVKRHRAAVTIATIATIGFAVGGTYAVRNIVEAKDTAERERSIAVARRQAAETLIDEMLSDMKDRLQAIGRIDLLSNLGVEIRNYYDALAKMPGGMPAEDIERMALAVELVGRAERDSGQSDRALATLTRGRALLEGAVAGATTPETRFKRTMIARLDFWIGTIHQQRGKAAAAIVAYGKSRERFVSLRAEAPTDRFVLLWSAENHDRLGDLLRNEGKIDQAFEEYSEAKASRERASSQASSRPSEEVRALSTSHLKLGSIYQARGESAAALAGYRAALRLRETVLESQADNVVIQEEVLEVQDALAELQRQIGDSKSAVETYQQALPIMDALVRREPSNTIWKRRRGGLYADLGFALLDSGDFKGGLAELDRAVECQQDLLARDPKSAQFAIDLSRSYMRAGDGHLYLGAIDDGIAKYELSLDIRQKLAKKDAKSAPYRRALAWSLHKLANAHAQKGDVPRALANHERVLAIRTKLVEESPTQSGFKNELASTEVALGRLLVRTDSKRAGELIDAGVDRARALVAADALSNEWKETLTQGLLARAEAARATNAPAVRKETLEAALAVATAGSQRAPQNPQWPGFLAEIHIGFAELAGDRGTRLASYKVVRDLLEPLASTGRLPAVRKNLLDRARAAR
ncbi:MAG: serine/threonine protein kinase [Deltaproteobacteria bacterium]|nr:serine/threonine protein kinase [Deltaproteobacteria bacterium]MDQ3298252.1 serine/threonine-protein kinase [Myxococcota bacterium]